MSLINIQIQTEDFSSKNDYYDEMNVQLAEDDYIQSRCGEIYISRQNVLVFSCIECKENFLCYDDFFSHMCEQHITIEEADTYYETNEESINEGVLDEKLIAVMKDEDEDVNFKPSIVAIPQEASGSEVDTGTEYSQDLFEAFETFDDYEALEEAETYKLDDYRDIACSSSLEINIVTKKTSSPTTKPNKMKTLAVVKGDRSPIPEEFIEPLPLSTPQFSCSRCPKKFSLEFDLTNHFKMHEDKRKHKCEICGFRFTLISNLRAHVQRHIGEKQYPCDKCEKRFWTSSERNTHQRTHTGERPFICEFCGNAFKTSGAMTDHEKRHTQKKRHKCNECNRCFLHLQVLREHMTTHSLERPHVCQMCNATFTRKHSLTQHLNLHSTEKRFICEICSKEFAQLPGLLAHKKRHQLA